MICSKKQLATVIWEEITYSEEEYIIGRGEMEDLFILLISAAISCSSYAFNCDAWNSYWKFRFSMVAIRYDALVYKTGLYLQEL